MLPIARISNPGGVLSNANQGPEKLLVYQDLGYVRSNLSEGLAATSSNKWYDGNFSASGRSVLHLALVAPSVVSAYWLQTAFDVHRRDPVSWSFRALHVDGSTSILDERSNVNVPTTRSTIYPPFYLIAPPPELPPAFPPAFPALTHSPLLPPFPPDSPPLLPGAPAYSMFEFEFTQVRHGPYDGLHLGAGVCSCVPKSPWKILEPVHVITNVCVTLVQLLFSASMGRCCRSRGSVTLEACCRTQIRGRKSFLSIRTLATYDPTCLKALQQQAQTNGMTATFQHLDDPCCTWLLLPRLW